MTLFPPPAKTAAAVIAIWTILAATAVFTAPHTALPMSLPNTLTLVAVSSMLMMLFARIISNSEPPAPPPHIIPADRPGMNLKDLILVLLSVAAFSYSIAVNVNPHSPDPATLHWLTSIYAAHIAALRFSIQLSRKPTGPTQAQGDHP